MDLLPSLRNNISSLKLQTSNAVAMAALTQTPMHPSLTVAQGGQVLPADPTAALVAAFSQQLQGLEQRIMGRGGAGSPPGQVHGFAKEKGGNPANPTSCPKPKCHKSYWCAFNHANKP